MALCFLVLHYQILVCHHFLSLLVKFQLGSGNLFTHKLVDQQDNPIFFPCSAFLQHCPQASSCCHCRMFTGGLILEGKLMSEKDAGDSAGGEKPRLLQCGQQTAKKPTRTKKKQIYKKIVSAFSNIWQWTRHTSEAPQKATHQSGFPSSHLQNLFKADRRLKRSVKESRQGKSNLI